MADLSVRLGKLHLRNPFIAASGCFGYGLEYAHAIDLSTLGGVAVKGLFSLARRSTSLSSPLYRRPRARNHAGRHGLSFSTWDGG